MFIFTISKKRGSGEQLILFGRGRQESVPTPPNANSETVRCKWRTNPVRQMTTRHFLKIIFCFFGLLTSAQGTQNFKPILDSLQIGQTYSEKSSTFKTKVTYLGTILNANKGTLFYVLTENYDVKAAIEWHGHSRIVFLGKNKRMKAFYSLNLPEELPNKLADNVLYFKDKKSGKVTKQKITGKLPDLICVKPDNSDCYEKEIK
jgi:hypothetical protein